MHTPITNIKGNPPSGSQQNGPSGESFVERSTTRGTIIIYATEKPIECVTDETLIPTY